MGALAVQLLPTTAALVLAPAIVVSFVARTALVPLLVMTLMDHPDVGPARTAAATGLFFTTAQIGGVAGPLITGILAEASGGFRLPLIIHSLVMVAIAAAVTVDRVAFPWGRGQR
jgi:predicted MFS family arabinose efflux permease